MFKVSPAIQDRFERQMESSAVEPRHRFGFRKWLRYYIDFCDKYKLPAADPASCPIFLKKLASKRHSAWQQRQAAEAVSLFRQLDLSVTPPATRRRRVDMQRTLPVASSKATAPMEHEVPALTSVAATRADTPAAQPPAPSAPPAGSAPMTGASWQAQFDALAGAVPHLVPLQV